MMKDDKVESSTNTVLKHLDILETSKRKVGAKTERKFGEESEGWMTSLTNFCKEHNGPVKELKVIVNQKWPELKSFFKQEIHFQRVTHQHDSGIYKVNNKLYKVNKHFVDQMVENVTVILCTDSGAEKVVMVFSCEDEVMEMLTGATSENSTTSQQVECNSQGLSFKPSLV